MNDPTHSTVSVTGSESPAQLLARLWDSGQRPDVHLILAAVTGLTPVVIAEALAIDQWRRWNAGERVPVEDYLSRYPSLEAEPEQALELIYGEFLVRQELGETPHAGDYFNRFPRHAEQLRQQLAVSPLLDPASTLATVRGADPQPGGSSPPPSIPGYEILGELGRGGMGVVYEALQLGLNRRVALKMILHGAHASEEDRARFRIEGEAIARLRHPNIVQVYQIGEHQGLPFFSLEFCGEGSLADRLSRGSPSLREAAHLVVILAQAVHAAHQQGIIHRDLKPGNILFTGESAHHALSLDASSTDPPAPSRFTAQAEPATLKITDFGLAKRLDEAGQTRTGSILGTPSYMAPEQAGGPGTAVTTLADVYALGAILYECLTGRPPFQGATALDTVLAVLHQPPISPSTLNPALDRGLELICLRCLEKDSARRYHSAGALADDLQCWLAGEPLSVQPPSLFLLIRSWVRQNFGSAGWAVLIGLVSGLVLGLSLWLILIQPALAQISQAYTYLPNQPRPWLVFPWNPPSWLIQVATLSSLLLGASLGLWIALLVRPRHFQADLTAGAVTGLVMGIVLFMTSFGWCAIRLQSATSDTDLWLVTQAAWSTQPEKAYGQLLERYPDLQQVPAEQRALVVHDMLMSEQLSAMPIGMWTGMFLSLSLCILLGISGTAVAGRLVRQHTRFWVLLLKYLEVVFPGAVFLGQVFLLALLGLFSATRINLPYWHPPLVLTTSVLVIIATRRRWFWALRLMLFLLLIAMVSTSKLFEIRG